MPTTDINPLSLPDFFFFFLNDAPTPDLSPFPLHDPLPIGGRRGWGGGGPAGPARGAIGPGCACPRRWRPMRSPLIEAACACQLSLDAAGRSGAENMAI